MLIGAWEIIVRAWQLYTKNFSLLIKYVLLSLLPGLLGALFVVALVSFFTLGALSARSLGLGIVVAVVVFIALVIALVWFGAWINFSLMRVIAKTYRGETAGTVGQELSATKKLTWRGIGASILAAIYASWILLAVTFLFALISAFVMAGNSGDGVTALLKLVRVILGVSGIFGIFYMLYMSVKLAFTANEAVIAEKTVRESLQGSKQLTSGRWWGTLWRLLAPGVFFWLVYMIVNLVLGAAGSANDVLGIIFAIIVILFNILLSPVPVCAVLVLYEELKKTPTAPAPVA